MARSPRSPSQASGTGAPPGLRVRPATVPANSERSLIAVPPLGSVDGSALVRGRHAVVTGQLPTIRHSLDLTLQHGERSNRTNGALPPLGVGHQATLQLEGTGPTHRLLVMFRRAGRRPTGSRPTTPRAGKVRRRICVDIVPPGFHGRIRCSSSAVKAMLASSGDRSRVAGAHCCARPPQNRLCEDQHNRLYVQPLVMLRTPAGGLGSAGVRRFRR